MKKVLHIVSSWGTGGVERYIYNYSKYLNKYSFDILTLRNSKGNSIFNSEKLNVYNLEEVSGNYINRLYKRKKLLVDFLEKHEYNIIHFDTTTADSFILAKFIKKRFNVKIVMHCHATNVEPPKILLKKILHKFSKIFYNKYADYYIGASEDTIKWMFPAKTNINKIVLNCGVELDKFKYDIKTREKIRKKYNLAEKYVIGTVGRFSQQKNPFFILNIIRDCIKIEPKIVFLWIGSGEYIEQIKSKAKKMGIYNNIIFLGVCDQVEKYYSALDLFILPSLYEANPIVCLEAQTNGLKCIISNKITKSANINGNVIFLDIKDSKNWANEIIKQKDNCKHKGNISKIIEKGYSVKDNANKLEEIYIKLEEK